MFIIVNVDIVVHDLRKMIIVFLVCGDFSETKLMAVFFSFDPYVQRFPKRLRLKV